MSKVKNEVKIFIEEENQESVFELGSNVPKESVETLEMTINSSSQNELKLIKPVVSKLAEIQSIKDLKYNPETKKESIDLYKKAKKELVEFSKSYKEMKEVLKRPHIEYNKKVDSIFNFFDNEKINCLNALNLNFDEYLKEEEEKKKELERKKKEEELKKIEELQKANEENQEKLNNQKIRIVLAEIESKVKGISFDVTASINSLNREGLENLLINVNSYNFDAIVSEVDKESLLSNLREESQFKEDLVKLNDIFTKSIEGSVKTITGIIQKLDAEQKSKELEMQNAKLEAENNQLIKDDNDLPFKPVSEQNNDNEKLDSLVSSIDAFYNYSKTTKDFLDSINFEDENLKQLSSVINTKLMSELHDRAEKLNQWVKEKANIFKNQNI